MIEIFIVINLDQSIIFSYGIRHFSLFRVFTCHVHSFVNLNCIIDEISIIKNVKGKKGRE